MPYTRPSTNPDWATGAGGVTPNVSNSGLPFPTGYPDNAAPSAKGWNWLFQLVGLWVGWLDQLTQSLLTSISSEASTRGGADTALDGRISTLESIAGISNKGHFNADFTSHFTASAIVVFDWKLHSHVETGRPDIAEITIPHLSGMSNSTGLGVAASTLPSAIIPSYNVAIPVKVFNNTSEMLGTVTFGADGSITFAVMQVSGSNIIDNASGFVNDNIKEKGFRQVTLQYPIMEP